MNKMSIALVSLMALGGGALAQPRSDSKGAASAATDPAAQGSAAPRTEMPKPPPEIAEQLKVASGTWKCTGTAMLRAGETSRKMNGTLKVKSDLDGFYIHDTFEATMPDVKGMKYHQESYSTFNVSDSKWRGATMINDGALMWETGEMSNGKLEATADTFGPQGQGSFREHLDQTEPKNGIHLWGEMSTDKGKTWNPVYDMTCKK